MARLHVKPRSVAVKDRIRSEDGALESLKTRFEWCVQEHIAETDRGELTVPAKRPPRRWRV